jgi:large subunit ribosomal protein L41
LTAKQGHNYYKGNRVGALGRHTRRGTYLIDYNRVRTYVVPMNINSSNVFFMLNVLTRQLTPFVPKNLPPPKPRYSEAKGGSGFGALTYLRAWNRRDEPPQTSGKAAILEARYNAARLSVAPVLFSKSNPPPKGKVVIVDRKKAKKIRRQRIRSRKAQRAIQKRKEKLLKKQPIVL